jgi:hypothetical protein
MDMYLVTILALLSLGLLAVIGLAIDRYREKHAHR